MNLRETYRHIRAIFQKRGIPGSPEFLSKEETFAYLTYIELSEGEKSILESSFRTRAKSEGDRLHFQFRISPSSLTESELPQIGSISDSMRSKLGQAFPEKIIEVTIKVSDCCGKGCYGCERYEK